MGYKEAPWVFKGRALYQLQLVKSEEARKYVPADFKLVELFGYTLGGFYLARYDDSPAGAFEELVALAGLVWNPPTSCAWAGRVYVNNRGARDHGLQEVGLPSRLASFTALPAAAASDDAQLLAAASKFKTKLSWWHARSKFSPPAPASTKQSGSAAEPLVIQIRNTDKTRGRQLSTPVCNLLLPAGLPPSSFLGPRIRMFLPSFSGATPEHPGLLKYSCELHTNVSFAAPALVSIPRSLPPAGSSSKDGADECMAGVLGGKPLLTMCFNDMEMYVGEPKRLHLPASQAAAGSPVTASTTIAGAGASR